MLAGLLPMIRADMRSPWSRRACVSGASPSGFGICEASFETSVVREIGSWKERWRYKRLPPEEWGPRERALGRNPLADLSTCVTPAVGPWEHDVFELQSGFPEVPLGVVARADWKVVVRGEWRHESEHITLKEARTLTLLARRLGRSPANFGSRHLVLSDSMALCFCLGKARGTSACYGCASASARFP